MDIFAPLYLSIGSALTLLMVTPGTEADPRELALLQNAQQEMVGDNGADALYRLGELGVVWPEKLPTCERDSTDCLSLAREHFQDWAQLPPADAIAWQRADDAVAALNQYDYFRYPFSMDAALPRFQTLMMNNRLHAYRFVDGAQQAALDATCRDAQLARKLLNSQNILIDSMIGAALLRQSVGLIAEMRAEAPSLALSPACDAVQTLPGATLAVCPLLSSEWRMQEEGIRAELAKLGKTDLLLASWYRQALANLAYTYSRYCEPDIIAAIARGELAVPPLEEGTPKHCSSLNPLCQIATPDFARYQRTLLNSNRYLAALDALRDTQAPLAQDMRRDNGQLIFQRFAEREEFAEKVEVALPLPGSRIGK